MLCITVSILITTSICEQCELIENIETEEIEDQDGVEKITYCSYQTSQIETPPRRH